MLRSRGVAGTCSLFVAVLVALQSILLAPYSSSAAEAATPSWLEQTAASRNKAELEIPRLWVRDSTWMGGKYPKPKDVGEEEPSADNNCSYINDYSEKNYNSSCELVKEMCGDAYELFDYLRFVTCDMGRVSLSR